MRSTALSHPEYYTMFKTLLLALALSLPGLASANDTDFGAEGANLIPIKNDAVRMVDEHVVIEGQLYNDQLDAWKVTVTFHFKNESQKEEKIQMGFPFPKFSADEVSNEHGELSLPHGRKPNGSLIYDFKATAGGKAVTPKEVTLKNLVKLEEDSPYKFANIWDVTFKPGEEIEVVTSYITGVIQSTTCAQIASYVLNTGVNWKEGKIGRSLIELKPNIPFITCDEDPEGGYEPRPAGYRTEGQGKDRKFIWDFKDFTPSDDVLVCLYSAPLYRSCLVGQKDFEQMSLADLRIERNKIYATYGYVFKSPDLKAMFEKEWWYQPNPKFDPKAMSKDDLELVKKIKAIEDKKKAGK